jgi:hypothetical protein
VERRNPAARFEISDAAKRAAMPRILAPIDIVFAPQDVERTSLAVKIQNARTFPSCG